MLLSNVATMVESREAMKTGIQTERRMGVR